MQYFAYALVVWSILAFCGLPLAGLLLPRELRRLALPAAPLFGYAYIVFVSYHLYRMNVGGTNLYAPYLLLPPLAAVLVPAVRRRLALSTLCNRDAFLMIAFAAVSFLTVSAVLLPADGRAVAMSIGNLDIVEYACDARYLQEFARNTTIGYMGESGWYMHAGDAFWFGPSLIAAVMSTLTSSEPFRLQSLVIAIMACQGAAFVYAIARDSLSLERPAASAVALLYALNPIVAFTVWEAFGAHTTSMTLMLAAIHLMMLAQSRPPEVRPQARYLPAIVLLSSAMLVTYHFMVAIVAALITCYILVLALVERSPRRLATGALLLAAAMTATALLNPLRVASMLGTLAVLGNVNVDWFIPWLSPDEQLGFNAHVKLIGGELPIVAHWLQALAFLLLTLALVLHLVRRRGPPSHLAFVFGLAFPALMLGLYYAAGDAKGGMFGGYRSYKITSTFLAFTLLAYGLFFGMRHLRWRRTTMAVGAALTAALIALAANDLHDLVGFANRETFVPPEELTALHKIEAMDSVSGIDVMDDGNFELFWIHYFTLRKPQIFARSLYGRVAGAFNEPFRLGRDPRVGPVGRGDIFEVESAGCDELMPVTSQYSLCRAKPNADVTVTADKGWREPEPLWRWSGPSADVIVDNRLPGMRARIKALYDPLRPGEALALHVNGEPVPVEESGNLLVSAPVMLATGRNLLHFTTRPEPMPTMAPLDDRSRDVMWRSISIEFPGGPAE